LLINFQNFEYRLSKLECKPGPSLKDGSPQFISPPALKPSAKPFKGAPVPTKRVAALSKERVAKFKDFEARISKIEGRSANEQAKAKQRKQESLDDNKLKKEEEARAAALLEE
jgi:hypothetical protein